MTDFDWFPLITSMAIAVYLVGVPYVFFMLLMEILKEIRGLK